MQKYKKLPSLGFGDALSLAFGRLIDFKGRSRRSEFWYMMLMVMIINFVLSVFVSFDQLVSAIVSIAVMFLGLSVTARRLQDTGKSAMFVYVSYAFGIVANLYTALSDYTTVVMQAIREDDVVSYYMEHMDIMATMSSLSGLWTISSLIVIVFCMLDGTPGTNKYGESPKYVEEKAADGDFEETV